MQRSESRAYLTSVREAVYRAWQLPPKSRPNQRVTLRFVVDRQGSIGNVAILKASDPQLAQSAVRALEQAGPYPIPTGAECIAGLKIVGTFSNPD